MDVQSMSLEFIDDASKSVEAEYREKNVSLIDETSLFIKLFDISAVKQIYQSSVLLYSFFLTHRPNLPFLMF